MIKWGFLTILTQQTRLIKNLLNPALVHIYTNLIPIINFHLTRFGFLLETVIESHLSFISCMEQFKNN